MPIDNIIPPEIINDPFYRSIFYIAAHEPVTSILEIGSSSGNGSTKAFVEGISLNPSCPTLYCLELSAPRFEALQRRYAHNDLVVPYNMSSVTIDQFATIEEVTAFYNKFKSKLTLYSLEEVLKWREEDIEYLRKHNKDERGIWRVKWENDINQFGIVLIDGSEFTGSSELEQILGARVIMLDDINSFKNSDNYWGLIKNPRYKVVEESWSLRNGYCIFRRVGR